MRAGRLVIFRIHKSQIACPLGCAPICANHYRFSKKAIHIQPLALTEVSAFFTAGREKLVVSGYEYAAVDNF
jgi:hypothetical protein